MKGAVQSVMTKPWQDKVFYTMVVGGEKYNTGTKVPPAEGSYVEFEYATNEKGYKNVKNWRVLPGEAPVVPLTGAVTTGVKLNKDEYWNRKEETDKEKDLRIDAHARRNSAISMVSMMLSNAVIPLPKKEAEKEGFVTALVAKYAEEFKNNKEDKTVENESSDDDEAQDSSPAATAVWG